VTKLKLKATGPIARWKYFAMADINRGRRSHDITNILEDGTFISKVIWVSIFKTTAADILDF
jgi:hypothetical protein